MDENRIRNHTYKKRRFSKTRSSQSKTGIIIGLSLACGVLFLLLLGLGIQLGIAARESHALSVVEIKQTRELEALRPQIARLQAEIAELVESRLPNLTALKFDEVLPINEGYVRNIVFTLAKKQGVKRYEYKMVLDNRDLTAVHPDIKLFFFNHLGIQVGFSEIGVDRDGEPTLDVLERGEIRTHSAVVELSEDSDPAYFMLRVIKPSFG